MISPASARLAPTEAVDDSPAWEKAVRKNVEPAGPVEVHGLVQRVSAQNQVANVEAKVVYQSSPDMPPPCSRINGEVSDHSLRHSDLLNANQTEDGAVLFKAPDTQRTVHRVLGSDNGCSLLRVGRIEVDLRNGEESDYSWVLSSLLEADDLYDRILRCLSSHDSPIVSPFTTRKAGAQADLWMGVREPLRGEDFLPVDANER